MNYLHARFLRFLRPRTTGPSSLVPGPYPRGRGALVFGPRSILEEGEGHICPGHAQGKDRRGSQVIGQEYPPPPSQDKDRDTSQVLGQGYPTPPVRTWTGVLPPPSQDQDRGTPPPPPPDRTLHGQDTAWAVCLLRFHLGGLSCFSFSLTCLPIEQLGRPSTKILSTDIDSAVAVVRIELQVAGQAEWPIGLTRKFVVLAIGTCCFIIGT